MARERRDNIEELAARFIEDPFYKDSLKIASMISKIDIKEHGFQHTKSPEGSNDKKVIAQLNTIIAMLVSLDYNNTVTYTRLTKLEIEFQNLRNKIEIMINLVSILFNLFSVLGLLVLIVLLIHFILIIVSLQCEIARELRRRYRDLEG